MTEKKKNLIYAVLCITAYMVVLWNLIPFVYGIIDDRSMMEIVSGQYLGKPDAHTIFMGYWYSLFLSGLYSLVPQIDWYAFCYIFLQSSCMTLVVYRLLNRQAKVKEKIIYAGAAFLVFLLLGLQAATQLTFTTTAAVLGVTVIFWYITSERINFSDWILLFLLCILTEQVRSSIFFMILPVCGILWIFRVKNPDRRERWNLMIPAAVLGVFVLSASGNFIGYGTAEWRDYQEYNQSRSAVYDYSDYTLPVYDGAEDFYGSIGIEKKSRARTLINYNYTADDRITPGFFEKYIVAYENAFPSGQSQAERTVQSVKDYVKNVLNGKFHMQHVLAIVLYGLSAVWCFFRKKWTVFWEIICVAGIQALLWIYLIYEGRTPERVIYSMNLMLMVTGILLFLEAFRKINLPERIWKTGMGAVYIVFFVLAFSHIQDIRQQNLEMSHRNEDIEALKEYCMEHSENFYFNDVTSMAFTTYNVQFLRREPYLMNYMSLGDWMSYSPVWKEKLTQNGITSVKEALYEWDNVYLICSFDKGLEYLISLYDDVECTEIDKIPGFKIYSLQFL